MIKAFTEVRGHNWLPQRVVKLSPKMACIASGKKRTMAMSMLGNWRSVDGMEYPISKQSMLLKPVTNLIHTTYILIPVVASATWHTSASPLSVEGLAHVSPEGWHSHRTPIFFAGFPKWRDSIPNQRFSGNRCVSGERFFCCGLWPTVVYVLVWEVNNGS